MCYAYIYCVNIYTMKELTLHISSLGHRKAKKSWIRESRIRGLYNIPTTLTCTWRQFRHVTCRVRALLGIKYVRDVAATFAQDLASNMSYT